MAGLAATPCPSCLSICHSRLSPLSVVQNWGEYMTECTFNWRMMKYVFTECHVYDEQKCYVPFDFQVLEGEGRGGGTG